MFGVSEGNMFVAELYFPTSLLVVFYQGPRSRRLPKREDKPVDD